jgi:ATP-dependent RNA helicase HelY
MAYARLRRELSDTEAGLAKARRVDRRAEVMASLEQLRPGDVIEVPTGRYSGMAVVIDPGNHADRDGPRPYVLTADRQARRLSIVDFPTPVAAFTRIRIPRSFNGRNPQSRRDLASTLRERTHGLTPPPSRSGTPSRAPAAPGSERIEALRRQLREHPCHRCPDREDHARWAERWFKLDRDARTLRRRIEQRTNTIARQFDRVCEVLSALDYLDGDTVTPRGRALMRIYNEMDLVTAEALRTGLWDDLDASQLAAVLSALVFESRRADDATAPRIPGGRVRDVLKEMTSLWADLEALEKEHKLDQLREPDFGFCWAAFRWAEGDDLDELLEETELAAGDFVRWMKQLLDLAGQVGDVAGGSLRETAREAVDRLRRGVVAYSSVTD